MTWVLIFIVTVMFDGGAVTTKETFTFASQASCIDKATLVVRNYQWPSTYRLGASQVHVSNGLLYAKCKKEK